MPKPKRPKKAYYSAHASSDGTIYLAIQTRKPMKRDAGQSPAIDEEGVWRWFYDKPDEEVNLSQPTSIMRNICISTALNVKRIVREQVGSRLDTVAGELADLKSHLKRIEEKIDSLLVQERR